MGGHWGAAGEGGGTRTPPCLAKGACTPLSPLRFRSTTGAAHPPLPAAIPLSPLLIPYPPPLPRTPGASRPGGGLGGRLHAAGRGGGVGGEAPSAALRGRAGAGPGSGRSLRCLQRRAAPGAAALPAPPLPRYGQPGKRSRAVSAGTGGLGGGRAEPCRGRQSPAGSRTWVPGAAAHPPGSSRPVPASVPNPTPDPFGAARPPRRWRGERARHGGGRRGGGVACVRWFECPRMRGELQVPLAASSRNVPPSSLCPRPLRS